MMQNYKKQILAAAFWLLLYNGLFVESTIDLNDLSLFPGDPVV